MSSHRNRTRFSWLGALAAALLLAGPASAFTIQIASTNSPASGVTYTGAQLGCSEAGDGTFQCSDEGIDTSQGPYQTAHWRLDDWSFSTDSDPFIIGNVSLTNVSGVTQQFTLTFTQATGAFGAGGTVVGGSVGGSVTADSTAGTISAPSGSAIYTALIDGSAVAGGALHADPFSVSTGGPFLTANVPATAFGTPIPSLPGPAVTTSIGIRLDFDLTPGDQAALTSVFVVEAPEPAGVALVASAVAMLAIAGRRRRR